jgi:hypothetical protein
MSKSAARKPPSFLTVCRKVYQPDVAMNAGVLQGLGGVLVGLGLRAWILRKGAGASRIRAGVDEESA